jgi:peptide/nickel transport system substrate-binding protein
VKGKNPLKDVRVRKAIYQAIDIETIKKKVMRDAAYPAGLLAASVVNGYDAKLDKRFSYDPAASKKLLAEAGYPKGFMIVLDCPNDRYVNDEAICQATAGMLAKVGIEVKLNSQAKAKHFAKIASLDTSFFMLGWAPLTFDVHNTFFNNVMTRAELIKDRKAESGQGNWNDGGYSNPKVDEAMEKAATEVDPKKRQALISEGMRIHKEDVGHLPLHSQALAWGAKKNIDLHQAADNTFCLRWVKIK